MSPAMSSDPVENQYQKGVIHLLENGVKKVPDKYILPAAERPLTQSTGVTMENSIKANVELPIIDFADLQGPKRSEVLKSLAKACEEYGFFQVANHGIPQKILREVEEVVKAFFELPFEERQKYMSTDMRAPVRYGTSFNQNKDGIFCWRDFLKLMCHPLPQNLPFWPSSPLDFRRAMVVYSKQTKVVFQILMSAILESLGLEDNDEQEDILKQCDEGSQLMVANCYPSCPEPDLTLGMLPHSDYGFLTLLLQDEAEGLQIQHRENWLTVKPLPNSFVVNVGDHLEIFSNGRYKSVLHRVTVNSLRSRISVASLHSLSFNITVRPSPKLINEENPRRYMDTDVGCFLNYLATCEHNKKSFLESRKLI